jgi:hypothetical protein
MVKLFISQNYPLISRSLAIRSAAGGWVWKRPPILCIIPFSLS